MSLDLIKQRPLTGVGAGHFSLAVVPRVAQMTGVTAQPVHNAPLLTASELGIIGGLLWLWLMIAPLIITIRQQQRQQLKLCVWGLTASLVALAVIGLFDFYSGGWPQGRLWRWLLWVFWTTAVNRPSIT
jgi:O-antigen ligase